MKHPDRCWDPTDTYLFGTGISFVGGKATGEDKLIAHLHLVPRLRISEAIALPPYIASWSGEGQPIRKCSHRVTIRYVRSSNATRIPFRERHLLALSYKQRKVMEFKQNSDE